MILIHALALILLAASCQRTSWHYHHIKEKSCACTCLNYRSEDRVQGIDIEFFCQGNNLVTYLQVATQKIPETTNLPKQARVIITSGEMTYTFLAIIHEGKQRVRLSETSQNQLIEWLQKGKPVTINMEGYEEHIDSARFAKLFKKLQHPPYTLPFRLPF